MIMIAKIGIFHFFLKYNQKKYLIYFDFSNDYI